jgi:hypothetical protein
MKVTDEIVKRACESMHGAIKGSAAFKKRLYDEMRAALEWALADVPEPSAIPFPEVAFRDAMDRMHSAEAKLEKVREWLDSDDCDGTECLHWNMTLHAILDEHP